MSQSINHDLPPGQRREEKKKRMRKREGEREIVDINALPLIFQSKHRKETVWSFSSLNGQLGSTVTLQP